MRLDHVAFAVPDLDASVRLFDGLPVGPVREFDSEDTREAYVEIAPVRILLMQPRGRSGPIAKRGTGLHHLGFVAPDVKRVLSTLRHWLVCPATFRGDTAWLVRPRERLLFELQPGEGRPPEGPALFHQVVLEVPVIADAHRLFLTLGIEGDVPVMLRKGERRYVEFQMDGKRCSFDGERVQ